MILNSCISIDWLQINCNFKNGMCWNSNIYDVEVLNRKTQHFNKVEFIFERNKNFANSELFTRGRLLATACSEPNKKGIKADTILIKFENDILYEHDFLLKVNEFIKRNNLNMKTVTRLDIAYDFLKFPSGHMPEKLIKDFASEKIFRLGKTKFTIANNLINERVKFAGKNMMRLVYQYLRFGLHSSPVSVYLYNKTSEMIDVKFKPHIFDFWRKNKLITENEYEQGIEKTQDIWRLEVSYKGSGKIVVEENGKKKVKWKEYGKEKITFRTIDVVKPDNIYLLWRLAIFKYFSFADCNGKNRTRQKIDLFKEKKPDYNLIDYANDKKDSGRAEKIFINKLEKTNMELKGTDDDLADMAETLRSYMIHSRQANHLNKNKDEKSKIIRFEKQAS